METPEEFYGGIAERLNNKAKEQKQQRESSDEIRALAQDATDRLLERWAERQLGQDADNIQRSFEIEWDGDLTIDQAVAISLTGKIDVDWQQ